MKATHSPRQRKLFAGVYRFSVAEFLVALVFSLISLPFLRHLDRLGEAIEAGMLTLVLVSAVLAVGHRRRTFLIAVVLVTPAIFCRWLVHFFHDSGLRTKFEEIYLVFALLFVLFIIFQLLAFVLRSPQVNSEVLCAGVSSYLLLGLLWSFAYTLLALLDPDAFLYSTGPGNTHEVMRGITSIYFSFITLSTVGYGDITPAHDMARMFAASEAMTGTLFVAILISRLVSMYSNQPVAKTKDDDDKK